MRKHITRLLTALLTLVILLPIVAQAAPTDGWTDEAEQAYQTVTQLVIQRVTESKDYLATARQGYRIPFIRTVCGWQFPRQRWLTRWRSYSCRTGYDERRRHLFE